MVDSVRLWHGAKLYVSPADPSALTAAGFNASAFTSGTNAYKEVGDMVTIGGEWGVMRKTAESEPMDRTSTRIALHNILDYGTIELEFERDDNNPGQAAFDTADSDTGIWSFKILFVRKLNSALPGGHDDEDGAIYLRGYVLSNTNPGGSGGDFIKRKVTVRLTAEPLTVGEP